ncbi:MAG: Na(+)-translocating NADH-quinone reductase subunit C [Planctomycetaceae bacterium]|nr:MAG: Na(+)-translocating NADH-quinone reductase subunit C [Planctomycetaceae bacterium]
MPPRDSLANTFLVSFVLCVVCSLAVSAAAVALRDRQEMNEVLDRQRNILDASGLALGEFGLPANRLSVDQVGELYSRVQERLVNLETGDYDTDLNPADYNPADAAKNRDLSVDVSDSEFNFGSRRREKVARVFLVKNPKTDEISQVVLPVRGQGLWSTLYGYLALRRDLETVQGLTFYEHGETPGLGGEVDNPRWKSQWVGLQAFDEEGNPALAVARGSAPSGSQHMVDGLSGATITGNGVTSLVQFWTGPEGYQKYLEKLAVELSSAEGDGNGNQ